MKYKRILIATLILLAIFTVGAVSASDDIDVMTHGSDAAVSEDNVAVEDNSLAEANNDALSNSTWVDEVENNPFFLTSPGPVDPNEESGVGLVLQVETGGYINAFDLNKNSTIVENLDISTVDPFYRDEGIEYRIPSQDVDFNQLENEDVVLFRFQGNDGSSCETFFQFIDRPDGNIHFDNFEPHFDVQEVINGDNPLVAILEIPTNPMEGGNALFFTGRAEIFANECLYSEAITEFNDTEIPIYISDVKYFEGCTNGDRVVFEFTGGDGAPLTRECRIFREDENGNIILEEDEDPAPYLRIYDGEIYYEDEEPVSVCTIHIPAELDENDNLVPMEDYTAARIYIASMDDELVFFSGDISDMEYESDEDEVCYMITLDELSNFDGLDHGDRIKFILWQSGESDDDFDYQERTVYFEEGYLILVMEDDDRQIYFDVPHRVNMNDNDVFATLVVRIEDVSGRILIIGDDNIVMFNKNLSDFDDEDIYYEDGTSYYNIFSSDLEDFTDSEGIRFIFWNDEDEVLTNDYYSCHFQGDTLVMDILEEVDFNYDAYTYLDHDGNYVGSNDPFILFYGYGYYNETEIIVRVDDEDEVYLSSSDLSYDEEENYHFCTFNDVGIFEPGDHLVYVTITYNFGNVKSYDAELGLGTLCDFWSSYEPGVIGDIPGVVRIVDGVSGGNVVATVTDESGNSFVAFNKSYDEFTFLDDFYYGMHLCGYYIALNDFQIFESGNYLIKLEYFDDEGYLLSDCMGHFYIEVSENRAEIVDEFSIGVRPIAYLDFKTPVQPGSNVVALFDDVVVYNKTLPMAMEFLSFDLYDHPEFITTSGTHDVTIKFVNDATGYEEIVATGQTTFISDYGVEVNMPTNIGVGENLTFTVSAYYPGDSFRDNYRLVAFIDPQEIPNVFYVDEADMGADYYCVQDELDYYVWSGNNAPINLGSLSKGTHQIYVAYCLNEEWWDNEALPDFYYGYFNVTVADSASIITKLTVPDVTTTYNDNAEIIAFLKEINGNPVSGVNVKITVGNLAKTLKTDANGKVALDISSLAPGSYTANVKSATTDVYERATATASVVVNKINTILEVPDVIALYNTTGKVAATLTDINGNAISGVNVKITVGSLAKTLKTNANGQVALDISGLDIGTYDVAVKSATTDIYDRATASATAEIVSKLPTVLTVPDVSIVYGSGDEIVATLTDVNGNAISGVNVKITVGSLAKTLKTDADGKVALDISSLTPGTYTANVKSATSDIYERATAAAAVAVNKIDTILEVPDVIVLQNGGGSVVATFKDVDGNVISGVNVKITVGSLAKTLKTDANGKVSLDISGLDIGTYDVAVKTATTDIYNRATASAAAEIVSKLPTVLTVPDVVVLQNGGGSVDATLSDIYGNAISGVNVKITVGSLAKTLKTDANGKVSLDISGLDIGTYAVAVKSATTDIYDRTTASATAEVVSRLPTVLTVPNAVAVSGISGSVVAFLKDINGNPVSGVNVKITVGSLAKTLKTDANGKVALDISSLAPGTYAVSVKSAIADIYERATATSTAIVSADKVDTVLTVPDISIAQNSGEKITATFKDVYGNVISGVNVKITVGSIAKTLKTDENGQVSLDVSSLAPGTYTATIKTATTEVYNRATATSKVTIY